MDACAFDGGLAFNRLVDFTSSGHYSSLMNYYILIAPLDAVPNRAIASNLRVYPQGEAGEGGNPKKRLPRDRYPKQRGTILKTDKNMHRGGVKWIYWRFSAISGGGKLELFRGNRGVKGRFLGVWGQKRGCFRGCTCPEELLRMELSLRNERGKMIEFDVIARLSRNQYPTVKRWRICWGFSNSSSTATA